MAHLCMSLADRGNRSHSRTPGIDVGIVPNSPRYSTGASGFGSHVSWCAGPPRIQRMMTDVGLAVPDVACASARNKSASERPIEPSTPALTKLRRSGCRMVRRNSGQVRVRAIDGSRQEFEAGSRMRGREQIGGIEL